MKRFFAVLVVAVGLSTIAKAQTVNHEVFALFVINIAKYSSWPTPATEFNITVVGKSKVYDGLVKYAGRGINGMKVNVTQVESAAGIGSPNIIYLSDGKSSQLDELVQATEGKPVMIVTEREGLYRRGAGFSFLITEEQKLKFDINNTELEKRKIKVSKNLSGMAHEVL